ncbi:MAG: elongation factor G, partial [Usitatibacteraceae bacterium]
NEAGKGFEFVDAIKGGVVPREYIPAVEKGVIEALALGAISGHPVVDVRVTVYDGKSHPVDSKEIAFSIAGRKAFIDAISKARPVLLEPIVNIEVVVPDAAIGATTGELAARRGHITGTRGQSAGVSTVTAIVPLSELKDYQARLKSLTSGQGSYSIELSHYEPAPVSTQIELMRFHNLHAKDEEE